MRDVIIKDNRWRQLPVNWRPRYAPLSQNRLIRIKERFDDIIHHAHDHAVCYRVDWHAGGDHGHIKKLISYYQRLFHRNQSKFHYCLALEKIGFQNLHFHMIMLYDSRIEDIPAKIKAQWKEIGGKEDDLNLKSKNPKHPRLINIGRSRADYEEGFRAFSYLSKLKFVPPKDEYPNAWINSHLSLFTHCEWISLSRLKR